MYWAGSVLELFTLRLLVLYTKILRSQISVVPLVNYFGISKVNIAWSYVHAYFAMFDPFLLFFTFLPCSDFLDFSDLPVSPILFHLQSSFDQRNRDQQWKSKRMLYPQYLVEIKSCREKYTAWVLSCFSRVDKYRLVSRPTAEGRFWDRGKRLFYPDRLKW